jgi:Fe-S oxidoreductase
MLDRAKRQLMHIIDVLRAEIEGGIPVVVLEPACASVFRDELTNLFPANEEAKRLRQQTYLLCEFLDKKAQDYTLSRLAGRGHRARSLSSQGHHEDGCRREVP